jgi:phosphatidylglycerophosphatase C
VKEKIAFFDFDGTITRQDTLLEFIKFTKGTIPFYVGFLLNAPYLIAYKLQLISNQKAKEKVLEHFFGGLPAEHFEQYCTSFSKNRLPQLIRPKALAEIKKLQQDGFEIVIVSASPQNWIAGWATENNIICIASQLEIQDGKLTGKLIGKNCHGKEKVRRIAEQYTLAHYTEILAYGDSRADKDLLNIAHQNFYKPFR